MTLADKREYARDTITGTDLIISIVIMMRGNEESTTKSRRVADAYERKRTDAAQRTERRPFTRMLPAWLRWNGEAKLIEAVPERAAVLQSLFEKASEGWGQHRLAQWLNEEGIGTWGGLGRQRKAQQWHRSYVKKLLTNSAVVGTFTPHQRQTGADGQ